MIDRYGRTIDYLRISVTDRCNLRCVYCMPASGVPWVPHEQILSYEQLVRLCRVFASLGTKKIKLTGGEPLVRHDVTDLVRALKRDVGFDSVTLTTNGLLLEEKLDGLLQAGLDGVNISVDALDEDCFRSITRCEGAGAVTRAIERALAVPNFNVKINCVPNEENESQLIQIAALARDTRLAVRFIELMPIGEGRSRRCHTQAEVRTLLESAFGPLTAAAGPPSNGPSHYFTAEGFSGKIGFISALSHQFCDSCNRVRLTASGYLKSCLQYETGVDLRAMLDAGADDEAIVREIRRAVQRKPLGHQFASAVVPGGERHIMSQIGG